MEELIPKVAWGYRPYWGPRRSPPGTSQPDRRERRLGTVQKAINLAVSIFLGIVLFLATARAEIDSVALPLVPLLGALVPSAIEVAVPKTEIAANGLTRLRVIMRKIAGSAVAAAGAWVVALLLGS